MGARMQVCPERIAAMIEELGSRMTPTGTVYADNGAALRRLVDCVLSCQRAARGSETALSGVEQDVG